ncbi:hypothetical protein R3P38DRAFT_3229423 [Favolaschia claudopus]|uniref:F-box domain-containing protein n=1 Tax=Favolaschia claudopus TaxID=2862362 RepID=A0AAV9ZP69_9AGAR
MAAQNPLKIQELLDHCISFLAHSTKDLVSCASVAHRWVQPAQSNLFRCPLFDISRALEKFYYALEASPHLAAYVHELHLDFDHYGILPIFHALCGLPFPQLDILHLKLGKVFRHPDSPHHIRQMLRLLASPRLRHVSLNVYWSGGASCAHMLSNCSPTIQHLYLYGGRWENESVTSAPLPNSFKSLHLHVADFDGGFPRASDQPARSFPFESSSLEALAINGKSIPWHTISKSNIQILSLQNVVSLFLFLFIQDDSFIAAPTFSGKQGSTDLNLALFPRLRNTIRTIVVSIYTDQTDELELNVDMKALDGELLSLPLTCLSTVEVEHIYWGRQAPEHVARLRDCFPRLLSHNLLRLSARTHDSKATQWQELVEQL